MSAKTNYCHPTDETVVVFWGNVDAKIVPEEVLYESANVLIINFKLSIKDAQFKHIQWAEKSIQNICRTTYHYVHKSGGIYNYIGLIERLKIKGICKEMAHMEIIILKNGSGYRCPKYIYPCATKNDICRLLNVPLLKSGELINKVSKIETDMRNRPECSSDW
jgi:hypothetical protein